MTMGSHQEDAEPGVARRRAAVRSRPRWAATARLLLHGLLASRRRCSCTAWSTVMLPLGDLVDAGVHRAGELRIPGRRALRRTTARPLATPRPARRRSASLPALLRSASTEVRVGRSPSVGIVLDLVSWLHEPFDEGTGRVLVLRDLRDAERFGQAEAAASCRSRVGIRIAATLPATLGLLGIVILPEAGPARPRS